MNSQIPAPASLRTPLLALGLVAVLLEGCASSPSPPKPAGNAPAPTKPLGIAFEEQITDGLLDGEKRVLWFYAPDPLPPHPGPVAIAPAGAPLVLGMKLGSGDRPEHEPYVRAGYVVVAYSVDGARPGTESDEALLAAVLAFKKARRESHTVK